MVSAALMRALEEEDEYKQLVLGLSLGRRGLCAFEEICEEAIEFERKSILRHDRLILRNQSESAMAMKSSGAPMGGARGNNYGGGRVATAAAAAAAGVPTMAWSSSLRRRNGSFHSCVTTAQGGGTSGRIAQARRSRPVG